MARAPSLSDVAAQHRNRPIGASRTGTLRITGIEAFELRRPFDGTASNAGWTWHERRVPLLRLTAADGTQGLGECWAGATGFEALPGPLHRQATALLGCVLDDPSPPPREGWAEAAAASGLDIALWDLRARRAGLPLFRLLGGADGAVPVYASGGLYHAGQDAVAAVATEMAGYRARGFHAAKMKIAGLPMDEDLRRVAAARHALGNDATLIVDAVGQLTRRTAPAWLDRLAAKGVRHIQAPLPDDDLAGLAALAARGPLTLIGGEREHRPAAFAALVRQGAVGLLQACPGLAGGITGTLALLALPVPLTLQCFSTAIMQAACFHLAAGRDGVQSAEYHRFHDTLYETFPPAMTRVTASRLWLDERPGLGIDPAVLDRPPACATLRRLFVLPD